MNKTLDNIIEDLYNDTDYMLSIYEHIHYDDIDAIEELIYERAKEILNES